MAKKKAVSKNIKDIKADASDKGLRDVSLQPEGKSNKGSECPVCHKEYIVLKDHPREGVHQIRCSACKVCIQGAGSPDIKAMDVRMMRNIKKK